jgi:D-galacturonate reductase
MKILVIGSGMYVTGRQNTGTGTILSSLTESSKEGLISSVTVVSRSAASEKDVSDAAYRINKLLQTSLQPSFEIIQEAEQLEALHQKEQFDACIISVPDHLHFEYAAKTLKLKIPTLIVKPLTPTLAEAKKLVEIQKEAQVPAIVEFHKRYDETNLYIKKAIAEKKIGKLLYFTVDYSQRISIPMETFSGWAHKTNIFQYLGVHYVDLFYFLTSYRPVKLSAKGTEGILKEKGIDTWDSVHAIIEWKGPENDSFISIHNTNWIDPDNTSALSDQKYKVIGTGGRIECDQKNRGIEQVTPTQGILHVNPYFSDYLPDENANLRFQGYGHTSIRQFLKDVKLFKEDPSVLETFDKTRPTFKQSLVSNAVVDAVNESLKKDAAWVNIEQV